MYIISSYFPVFIININVYIICIYTHMSVDICILYICIDAFTWVSPNVIQCSATDTAIPIHHLDLPTIPMIQWMVKKSTRFVFFVVKSLLLHPIIYMVSTCFHHPFGDFATIHTLQALSSFTSVATVALACIELHVVRLVVKVWLPGQRVLG